MKFRVISDLHIDINREHSLTLPKDDIFTVICGDTSGYPDMTEKWIRKNVRRGILVSGNHLVYNDLGMTVQELREDLAKRFSPRSRITYLDTECGCFTKETEGVLFIGTCMYSDMRLSEYGSNPEGVLRNSRISASCMNDYRWGILERTWPAGTDNPPSVKHISPEDYIRWFDRAFSLIDKAVTDNELLPEPKPVVVATHYPLIRKVPDNSFYVDRDNLASYGNDLLDWFKTHPSVKCHCCGHTHDMMKGFRYFKEDLGDGRRLLVVNNSFGYYKSVHDMTFNPNRFVDTDTWEVEEIPESESAVELKKQRYDDYLRRMRCFF